VLEEEKSWRVVIEKTPILATKPREAATSSVTRTSIQAKKPKLHIPISRTARTEV
jgi:hypothetical protein